MSLVLDAGGLSAMARDAVADRRFNQRQHWPPEVPVVVLTEALTGDHRRDHAVNRLLKICTVAEIDETPVREAARLRTATGRAGEISAVDAIVAAFAASLGGGVVLTSDPTDLRALAAHTTAPFAVGAV